MLKSSLHSIDQQVEALSQAGQVRTEEQLCCSFVSWVQNQKAKGSCTSYHSPNNLYIAAQHSSCCSFVLGQTA